MPKPSKKRKTEESSSDSDSGPEDRNPKKTKGGAAAAGGSGSKEMERDSDGNQRIHLDGKRFVTVRPFKGTLYVDIREFYDANGELRPGKKGIALNTAQWNKLKGKIDEIDDAIRNTA